ncbi:MAG: CYCXC family (seleno)protein [Vicinamibacteria bacterium]
MSKKGGSKKETIPEAPPPVKGGGVRVRWAAIGILVLGTAFFLYASLSEGPPASPDSRQSAVEDHGHSHEASRPDPGQKEEFRYFEDPAEAHPLPVTLPPSEFRNQGIANSYRIAKDIPEVLAQQPCLCGCDNTSDDHRSLLDCYIDQHASTCLVCMKEAVLAEQMTAAGSSAKEIREAILRHEFSEVSIGN